MCLHRLILASRGHSPHLDFRLLCVLRLIEVTGSIWALAADEVGVAEGGGVAFDPPCDQPVPREEPHPIAFKRVTCTVPAEGGSSLDWTGCGLPRRMAARPWSYSNAIMVLSDREPNWRSCRSSNADQLWFFSMSS
jgi:hypothetical protein